MKKNKNAYKIPVLLIKSTEASFYDIVYDIDKGIDEYGNMNNKSHHDYHFFIFGNLTGSEMHESEQRRIVEFIPVYLFIFCLLSLDFRVFLLSHGFGNIIYS